MKNSVKRIQLDRSRLLGFRKAKSAATQDADSLKHLRKAMVGGKVGIKPE